MGGLGITAGAHRLWAHRTYKAKLPLKVLLVCFQTLAGQVKFILSSKF
jgi:stearoyl-CoA desaturase (delta-9 desaturase)